MSVFYIKENDTAPIFEATCKDADDNAVDITGATAVMTMTNKRTGVKKLDEAAMVLSDAANGVVQRAWIAGDTDTAGDYNVEVQITYSSGAVETFPNYQYETVRIFREL